jgi:hypothetical protein
MKFIKYYIIFVRLFLLILLAYHFLNNDFRISFSVLTIFALTFVHDISKKIFKFELSPLTIFLYILISFSSIYLSESLNFYDKFKYLDIVEHTLSGIIFVDLGLSLIKQKKIKCEPTIVFLFCFAVTMATIWEILEFTSDYFFNTNHQKWMFTISEVVKNNIGITKQPHGLIDTMTDIMAVIIGTISMIFFTRKKYSQPNYRKAF